MNKKGLIGKLVLVIIVLIAAYLAARYYNLI